MLDNIVEKKKMFVNFYYDNKKVSYYAFILKDNRIKYV